MARRSSSWWVALAPRPPSVHHSVDCHHRFSSPNSKYAAMTVYLPLLRYSFHHRHCHRSQLLRLHLKHCYHVCSRRPKYIHLPCCQLVWLNFATPRRTALGQWYHRMHSVQTTVLRVHSKPDGDCPAVDRTGTGGGPDSGSSGRGLWLVVFGRPIFVELNRLRKKII